MSLWSVGTLGIEEIEELKKNTVFEVHEIESLYERFVYLDRSKTGFLTFAEFQMIPEFYSCPFSKLLISHLERMNSFEKVSFASYLEFLEIFNEKTDKEKRTSFLFSLFDLEKIGKIRKEDLRRIYGLMYGDDNASSDEAVSDVLIQFDSGNKGFLDFNDFCVFYDSDKSLETNMLLNFEASKEDSFWNEIWREDQKRD